MESNWVFVGFSAIIIVFFQLNEQESASMPRVPLFGLKLAYGKLFRPGFILSVLQSDLAAEANSNQRRAVFSDRPRPARRLHLSPNEFWSVKPKSIRTDLQKLAFLVPNLWLA